MIRKAISLAMIISGLLMIIGGLGVFIPTTSTYAQSVPTTDATPGARVRGA